MKRILIVTLLISASAFALAVNAQEVFQKETVQVQDEVYQEPITISEPTAVEPVQETTAVATEETITTPVEDVSGPQSIVNIPEPQEAPVATEIQETQETTLSVDDEIRKDGEEKALKIFNAIDADGDSAITQEEFLSFHSKLIERKISKLNEAEEPAQVAEPSSQTAEPAPEVAE